MSGRQTINSGGYITPVDFHIDWREFGARLRALNRVVKSVLLVLVMLLANLGGILLPQAHASSAEMLLFWDPTNGSVPKGWCQLTGFNGYFPRGASPSATTTNWGTVFSAPAGSGPHTPGASITVSGPSAGTSRASGSNANAEAYSASDLPSGSNPTLSITADSGLDSSNPDIPAFANLELMEYNGSSSAGTTCSPTTPGSGPGVPNIIPKFAIAMFGSSIPSGWSNVTSAFSGGETVTNKMIRIGTSSCASHCGGDTQSNDITVRGLTGDGLGTLGVAQFLGGGLTTVASSTHTHAPPAAMTCNSGCSSTGSTACTLVGAAGTTGTSTSKFTCTATGPEVDPTYVQPLLGEAGADTATLSIDLTAMFDADPGSGWVVQSNGGAYTGAFIRPANTPNLTPTGNDTRPAENITGVTGNNIGNVTETLGVTGTDLGANTHNHTYTVTTSNATNTNVPPYFDVVVAQKVNFTLQSYQWYVDPCPSGSTSCGTNNDVSDAWPSGSLGLAVKTGLPAVPAPYNPPNTDAHTQLRLRVQILVSGLSLSSNNVAFGLQYAKTNYADCVSDPSKWNAVGANGSGEDWTYGTNSVTDNSTLASSVFSPASDHPELFSKSTSPSNNPVAAAVGTTIEYDWLIQDNAATGATQYAIRPVQLNPDGTTTLLSYYGTATGTQGFNSTCPVLVTSPSVDQDLRHGEFFQTNAAGTTGLGSDQGFEWAD
ncbi:MAG TPA: hypothetical protein VG992_05110 [Candidatus Saccharimonadales bacterium]|nr:hypothetical protein [Candidatus Saccharimonadales bacterium]